MKTQTKILSSLVIGGTLMATTLSAHMQPMQGQGQQPGMLNQQLMMQHNTANMPYMKKSSHGIFALLNKINLTQEQEEAVQKIMSESRKNMPSKYEAFSSHGFDKDKYIKNAQHQRENMIKSRAESISKVYELLTSKQKEQLKVLMDLKDERMKEGRHFDQNCNGRR